MAVCYATGPLIASRKLKDAPPIGMTAACLGFAAIVYAPAAALTWPAAMPSAEVLGAIVGLAVLCTAVAFLFFFALIAEVGPARATVITYVNPAVAVALGVLGSRRAVHAGHGRRLRAHPRRLGAGDAVRNPGRPAET